jgi:lipid-A-disaccharide synthase
VPEILISAGEASGDMYASWLMEKLQKRIPGVKFFGCAGEKLKALGCEAVVDAASIATVGLTEVIADLPRIYGEFKRLVQAAEQRRPDLAILVDSPDFNLRVASRMKKLGIPVLYLVAPQTWAWRPWRASKIARTVDKLLCIIPFEEAWFKKHGVKNVEYIGHPLALHVRASMPRAEFFKKWNLNPAQPLVPLLPGSRRREIAMNLPAMLKAAPDIHGQCVVVAAPGAQIDAGGLPVIQGAWDALANCGVAIVASGTVTIEAALLGAPMVVVYRVTQPTWRLGRLLVRTPFYSMVNLVAGERVVDELIQSDFTPARLAREANRLLDSAHEREIMRRDLMLVAQKLLTHIDPMVRAADRAMELLKIKQSARPA